MCACRCGIRVHLREGQVRYIDGNPAHPLNKGIICAKGSSGIMKQNSPARLTQPLLRKAGAARGAGEFEPISWERAFEHHDRAACKDPLHRPQEIRPFHRTRPDAGPDRPVRQELRNAQLRGPRRLLLGQHGRGHDLHHRRQFLGVRRPGPGSGKALRDDRHRRGPSQQSDEDGDQQVQAPGRPLHLHQSDPHRLFGGGRRVDPDPSGHRRRPLHGAAARADPQRADRPRLPQALHQRAAAGGAGRRRAGRPVRLRSGGRPARRRPQSAQQAGLGRTVAGACAMPTNRTPSRPWAATTTLEDGTRVAPSFQLLQRTGAGDHAGLGRADHRHSRRAHPPARTRARRDRAASRVRAADPVDRRLGRRSIRASPAGRSRSTRCAAWPRIPTASRPPAPWRS